MARITSDCAPFSPPHEAAGSCSRPTSCSGTTRSCGQSQRARSCAPRSLALSLPPSLARPFATASPTLQYAGHPSSALCGTCCQRVPKFLKASGGGRCRVHAEEFYLDEPAFHAAFAQAFKRVTELGFMFRHGGGCPCLLPLPLPAALPPC